MEYQSIIRSFPRKVMLILVVLLCFNLAAASPAAQSKPSSQKGDWSSTADPFGKHGRPSKPPIREGSNIRYQEYMGPGNVKVTEEVYTLAVDPAPPTDSPPSDPPNGPPWTPSKPNPKPTRPGPPTKPSTPKRNVDVQGAGCGTSCGFGYGPRPDPFDCSIVYNTLYSIAISADSAPHTLVKWTFKSCAAFFINNSNDWVRYDLWDYGGITQWLNGYCLPQGANIGTCLFYQYPNYGSGVYVSVNVPNYFG